MVLFYFWVCFLSFFVLFIAVKTDSKLTLDHMGIFFLLFNLKR